VLSRQLESAFPAENNEQALSVNPLPLGVEQSKAELWRS
jgi:hypothetical protein